MRHPVERYFTSTVSVDRVSGTVVTGPTASARAGRRLLQVLFGFATSPQIWGGEAGRSGALPFHGWARPKLHVRLDAQDRRFGMIRDAAGVQIVNSLGEWGLIINNIRWSTRCHGLWRSCRPRRLHFQAGAMRLNEGQESFHQRSQLGAAGRA